jgi:hypothetical protein
MRAFIGGLEAASGAYTRSNLRSHAKHGAFHSNCKQLQLFFLAANEKVVTAELGTRSFF